MKVALCLLAVLAVALARPQNYGEQFWPEALQRAQQQGILRPEERLLTGLQVAPLVNQLENVPFDQPVSIDQIVVPFDEPQVYNPLQRSLSGTVNSASFKSNDMMREGEAYGRLSLKDPDH
uniref:Uncharacterized protein n=1 Tax=Anopheles culicifacies TaxID=139723 RepID=A0A182LUI6_9DIPT